MAERADVFPLREPARKQFFFEREAQSRRHVMYKPFSRYVDSGVYVKSPGRRLLLFEAQHFSTGIDQNRAAVQASVDRNYEDRHIGFRGAVILGECMEIGVAVAIHNQHGIGCNKVAAFHHAPPGASGVDSIEYSTASP
jgi:hypothetical protein